jgi:hypothetical protein
VTLPSTQEPTQRKERTRSILSAGLEKNLSMYAMAAGSAGVALLACVQPAEAKVVYTKTEIAVPINGGVIQFDINGDGQMDFGLYAFGNGSTCTLTQKRVNGEKQRGQLGCPFNDQLKAVPAQAANEILQAGTSFGYKCAADLGRGMQINGLRPFAADAMVMWGDEGTSEGNSFCAWTNNSRQYLGVKFLDTRGKVHFGWVRVAVNFTHATITGYAYETEPGKPIIAGAVEGADGRASVVDPSGSLARKAPKVPEPVSLGRLAQGADGLAAWRSED